MKSSGCHHIAVKTSNLAAMRTFYQEVLGFTPLKHPAGKKDSVWFQLGEVIWMLEEIPSGPPPQTEALRPGFHVVAFPIEAGERAQWCARLGRHGVKIISESPFSLYFCDPDGNRLALSHYPEGR